MKSPKSQIEGLLGEKHQIFLCFFLYLCLGFNPLQAEKPRFVDITADVGIDFKHAGGIDKRVIPAVVGSGAAFADYDNDGDLDLYIVNSSTKHDTGTGNPRNALYQNNGNSTLLMLRMKRVLVTLFGEWEQLLPIMIMMAILIST